MISNVVRCHIAIWMTTSYCSGGIYSNLKVLSRTRVEEGGAPWYSFDKPPMIAYEDVEGRSSPVCCKSILNKEEENIAAIPDVDKYYHSDFSFPNNDYTSEPSFTQTTTDDVKTSTETSTTYNNTTEYFPTTTDIPIDNKVQFPAYYRG